MEHITLNLAGPVRYDTLEGRNHLVVPMIMLVEGVHAGSQGPLYYPSEELQKTKTVWNHKPIVVYHPTINGEGVSACDPTILNTRKVGLVLNTACPIEDGIAKLKAEAWIDIDKANVVDDRIVSTIEKKKMMELSTGLFTDNMAEEGEWKGKKYQSVARNYRPDHLALLPDQKGACSIADGAGLLRNAEQVQKPEHFAIHESLVKHGLATVSNDAGSFDEIRTQLCGLVYDKYQDSWVVDVYDSYVIYGVDGKLFKMEWKAKDKQISLVGVPAQVQRVTEYQPVGILNSGISATGNKGDLTMSKDQLVAQLIANGGWGESDKVELMALSEPMLTKMVDNAKKGVAKGDDEGGGALPNKGKKKTDKAGNQVADSNSDEPEGDKGKGASLNSAVTVEQYVSNAPPEVREMLQAGLSTLAQQKQELVDVIVANKANMFSKEFLATKSLPELQGMAALARSATPVQNGQHGVAMFHGAQGGGSPVQNAAVAEEPLPLPVMNFAPSKN